MMILCIVYIFTYCNFHSFLPTLILLSCIFNKLLLFRSILLLLIFALIISSSVLHKHIMDHPCNKSTVMRQLERGNILMKRREMQQRMTKNHCLLICKSAKATSHIKYRCLLRFSFNKIFNRSIFFDRVCIFVRHPVLSNSFDTYFRTRQSILIGFNKNVYYY